MTTTAFSINRGDYHQDIAQAVGGAVTPDILVTVEDVLTREQIVLGLEALKMRILEVDWPAV